VIPPLWRIGEELPPKLIYNLLFGTYNIIRNS
jgi:hypothetical protein